MHRVISMRCGWALNFFGDALTRLFTVPYFFVRSLRYSTSYR